MNIVSRYLVKLFPPLYWRLGVDQFLADSWQRKIFPQHRWLLEKIKETDPESILEVGCGFGRNLNYLIEQGIDPKKLSGVDFSPKLFKLARKNLPKTIKLRQGNILRLPFATEKFALVFTHGVLMHLKPDKVLAAFNELLRVSKKQVIIIEEIRQKPQKLNHFTWAHDYEKIVASLPLEIVAKKNYPKLPLKCLLLKKLNTTTPLNSTRKN